jgi:serine/threonine protein kinase
MQPIGADQFCGQTIHGYHVEEYLGKGRLTALYRVRKRAAAESRVLTIVMVPERLQGSARERFFLRFDEEAARLVQLKHPHIFPLEGWGQQAGYPYLLMPDQRGKTLATELRHAGGVSLAYAAAVLDRVAETLEYALDHGVLHRNLSPARIFLHAELFIQVAGFGLVSLLERRGIDQAEDDPHAHLQTIAGTYFEPPEYLAPEVVLGRPGDGRADVYAMGILLWDLLSGHPPFTGGSYLDVAARHVRQPLPSLHALRPDVPLALELVVHQALKRDPSQRFQSPRDLAAACLRVLTRRPFSLVIKRSEAALPGSEQGSEQPMPIAGALAPGPSEEVFSPTWRATSAQQVLREQRPAPTTSATRSEQQGGREGPSSPATRSERHAPRAETGTHPEEQQAASSSTRLDGERIDALFSALESMPRPTFGTVTGGRILVPVPEPVPREVTTTLREMLDAALAEILPTRRRHSRRRFGSMFRQK